MFNLSSSQELVQVNSGGVRHCEHCDQEASYSTMLEYTQRSFYMVVRWVTGRFYYYLCSNCLGTMATAPETIDPKEAKAAVPFFHRNGWMLGVAAALVFVIGATIAHQQNRAGNETYLAAPQVGDIYQLDMAKVQDPPEARVMHMLMRIQEVRPEGIVFQLATHYYDQNEGVDDDIRSGKASGSTYYGGDPVIIPREELRRLYDEGTISDIDR